MALGVVPEGVLPSLGHKVRSRKKMGVPLFANYVT